MMKVIEGGFKKGDWLSDREAYSDEEIELWNDRFKQLMSRYPHLRPLLESFLWNIKPTQKPALKIVDPSRR